LKTLRLASLIEQTALDGQVWRSCDLDLREIAIAGSY
ncbi:MAG: gfo/Idh/MocA family oxidoreductase, partial [Pseudanabaena sp.]